MPPHAEDDFFAPAAEKAEKALSFISRQLKDVGLSADRDMKAVGSFPRSIRPFSGRKENWESNWFKGLGSSGNEGSAEKFFRQIKDGSLALSKPGALDDLEPFKSLKEVVPSQFPQFRPPTLQSGFPHAGPVARTHSVSASDAEKMRHQGQKFGEEWQLLRRMRESLKELDHQVATSKTEFFESMAKNLKLAGPGVSGRAGVRQKMYINDVAPLDVPELLEHLVQQSEPFLDQLGVTKEASAKMRAMIRNCSKRVDSLGSTLGAALSERVQSGGSAGSSGREEQDVDLRLARVMESTGYKYGLAGPGPAWHRGRGGGAGAAGAHAGKRKIAVVTTASLPWMTGTSINPLLRAAYLSKDTGSEVTLVVPWLPLLDQEELYPNKMTFTSPAEQEEYVRNWLRGRVGFEPDFKIAFYPGRYHREKRSILAVGDITSFIPGDGRGDLAVLEEPEHLTWYHHGARWQDRFQQVVGIVHTNYLEYARREKDGAFYAFLLEHVNSYMVKTYCHKVVRLSAATQEMPKSVVCNVHGVSPKFLDIGARMAAAKDTGKPTFTKGAYFLGKMIWTKGYRELVDLMDEHKQSLEGLRVDVYGSGDDSKEVHAAAAARNLPFKFHRGRDHADTSIQSYKVFINPSMSDVVCTTTAEALAMGKIVVCADHPSNAFFRDFPNCYTYKTPAEFIEKVKQAMAAEPQPLTDEERHKLSWDAATERFLEIAETPGSLAKTMQLDGASTATETASRTPRHTHTRAKKQSSKLKYSASMPNLQQRQADTGISGQPRAETPPHTRAGLPSQTGGAVTPLSLSVSGPDMDEVVERAMHGLHFLIGCCEPIRLAGGAVPGTGKVSFEQCKEMGVDPPMVRDPVYTW